MVLYLRCKHRGRCAQSQRILYILICPLKLDGVRAKRDREERLAIEIGKNGDEYKNVFVVAPERLTFFERVVKDVRT